MVDSELSLSIPIKAIYDMFICPVCFSEMTEAMMTSCGHNYCGKCIKECLDRKPACPICQQPCSPDRLVKNHALDSMFNSILAQKKIAAQQYVSALFRQEDAKESPIELIFRKHAKNIILDYEVFYNEMAGEFAKKKIELKEKFALQIERSRATCKKEISVQELLEDMAKDEEVPMVSPAGEKTDSFIKFESEVKEITEKYHRELAELDSEFEHASSLVVQDFEKQFAAICSSPKDFLLSISVTLKIHGRPSIFFEASVKSTTLVKDLRTIYMDKSKAISNEIMDFGPDSFFCCQVDHESDPGTARIRDERKTLWEVGIRQKSTVFLMGQVRFAKDKEFKLLCFLSRPFEKGMVETYFRCKTCQQNWICAACSKVCHAGHDLIVFRADHAPSYQCCYCSRKSKKDCSLLGQEEES
jgi:hypothetical protein